MSDTVRLTKLEFENVGAIKRMALKPSPITIILGRNGAGKSAICRAFVRLFRGGYDPKLIRKGCDKATIRGEFSDGNYALRTIDRIAKESTIRVFSQDGEEVRPPQKAIEEYATGYALDPLTILTDNKKKRLEYIEEMLDVRVTAQELLEACTESEFLRLFDPAASAFTNIDAISDAAYDQRTKINQDKSNLQGAVQTIREGVPTLNDEKVDWASAERSAREEHTAATTALKLEEQGIVDAAEAARQREDFKLTAAQREIEADYQAAMDRALQRKVTRMAEAQSEASSNKEIIGATEAAELTATRGPCGGCCDGPGSIRGREVCTGGVKSLKWFEMNGIHTLLIDPSPTNLSHRRGRIAISELFPALAVGPNVIVGNPPYAELGPRQDLRELASTFETIAVKAEPSSEIYVAFLEQMIRLANPRASSAALVLPLSLAFNVTTQFTATRKLIEGTPGSWNFAFFDREPHALFGEDVKTRNTIVLWSRTAGENKAQVFTGPLRKWRGDSRAAMFQSITYTPISSDVRAGIPKLEGVTQARALEALSSRWGRFEQIARSIERVDLSQINEADGRCVFVGPTAYNFINVFLRPTTNALLENADLSEHPLHIIKCTSRADALMAFAILSSHLAYWWWHTHGDGFHVSRKFLAEFPFGGQDLTGDVARTLSANGEELWKLIEPNPVISLNRGKTSLAFTPNGYDALRRKSDHTLARLAGLGEDFVDELQQFTARTVTAAVHNTAIDTGEDRHQ